MRNDGDKKSKSLESLTEDTKALKELKYAVQKKNKDIQK